MIIELKESKIYFNDIHLFKLKMDQTQKQALGRKGESLVCKFLEQNGHRIIQKNYRIKRSEIDIISLENNTLVVTEVKSFYARPLGAVEMRVNRKKQQKIIQGVYGFLDENPKYMGHDVRLDVIIVDFSQYPAQIKQHQGAYYDDNNYR